MLLFEISVLLLLKSVRNQIMHNSDQKCTTVANSKGENLLVKHAPHDDIQCEPNVVFYQERIVPKMANNKRMFSF